MNAKGKNYILFAGNARWDKLGSGRKKGSLSGYLVFNGKFSKLTTKLEPMSQSCIKCSKGAEHEPSQNLSKDL
jgi:hypothetical protein